jgi:hypothetical protein
MVPVAMVVLGIALGLLGRSRRAANRNLVLAFALILLVQSVVVFGPGKGSSTTAYWLVQAGSLLVGLLLLNGLRHLRNSRRPAHAG